jgi:hypothetical protein
MDGVSITGTALISVVGFVVTTFTSVVVYLYKANERHVSERITTIQRNCAISIQSITQDRDFWRDVWVGQRAQTTQRDALLQKAAQTATAG